MNQFKQGDWVIGREWPDLIPAKIIEVVRPSIDVELEFPLVDIEFTYNGVKKTAIMYEYRLKKYEPASHQLQMF